MAKIKLKSVDGIVRKTVSDAFAGFMRHCKLKNLAPYSIRYYDSNVKYFLDAIDFGQAAKSILCISSG